MRGTPPLDEEHEKMWKYWRALALDRIGQSSEPASVLVDCPSCGLPFLRKARRSWDKGPALRVPESCHKCRFEEDA